MQTDAVSLSGFLQDVVKRNRSNDHVGVYSVCSANAWVLEAAMQQALEDESVLCIESTSNQVNQFGGYTGMTPALFVEFVHSIAARTGFPVKRVLLGSDHLGPYPWRNEPAESAIDKACALVQDSVRAGYCKIHLDASMACGDDPVNELLPDAVVAQRAARVCEVAEKTRQELKDAPGLVYVIGTEVPVPGGEQEAGTAPVVTRMQDAQQTLNSFHGAFIEHGLSTAWERVVGLVVQPGVEFGDASVFEYDREKAASLSQCLPAAPSLVYEAHSTDYQPPLKLRQMVEDHFGILKVGPWLTFAFREAVFALSALEREWIGGRRNVTLSQVPEALERAMVSNPVHWRPYYHGDEHELSLARRYSYSDRCRYYWPDQGVRRELSLLAANLSDTPPPLTLLSQYLPEEYDAVRDSKIRNRPQDLIHERIRKVARIYASACGSR